MGGDHHATVYESRIPAIYGHVLTENISIPKPKAESELKPQAFSAPTVGECSGLFRKYSESVAMVKKGTATQVDTAFAYNQYAQCVGRLNVAIAREAEKPVTFDLTDDSKDARAATNTYGSRSSVANKYNF